MNHLTRALIILSITHQTLPASENNLLLVGATAVATGIAGGIIGYHLKSTPHHTIDTLKKRADTLHKQVEGVVAAEPLALAVQGSEQAAACIVAFESEAGSFVRDSFDATLIAQLSTDERAHLETVRMGILEKQRIIKEKQALIKRVAPHADLMRTLNTMPVVPTEQVGSRVASLQRIRQSIDALGTTLQKSRSTAGAETMAQIHTAAEQRITYLIAQRDALERSAEYAREIADLKAKTAHEQAQAKRIQEERTTKEMIEGFHESQRRLEKAEKMATDALAKEGAAAATVLAAEWKVRKAQDSEQDARVALSREQLKSTKLELALQQSESRSVDQSQKLQSAQQEITRLKNSTQNTEYYSYYVRKQAELRADAAKAFDALEQEVKQPSMNPENHQEWRKVLEKKIETTRHSAVPECSICAEELTSDIFVTQCDQGTNKVAHEYHRACIQQQKGSSGGKPLTCAQCRARVANAASI